MVNIVFEHKHTQDEYTIDIKIYQVKKDKSHPEGFKYTLVLIKNGKRLLGYDNHEKRGHHIHRGKRELPYEFIDEWKLIQDFMEEVKKITRGKIK